MALEQNLTVLQNNDTQHVLSLVDSSGRPVNLTGLALTAYLKASETAADSTATTYTVGNGLTVTAALGGQVTWKLPHTAASTAGPQWWRLDAADASGDVTTYLYGTLYILAV